jgi:hypothetical protein
MRDDNNGHEPIPLDDPIFENLQFLDQLLKATRGKMKAESGMHEFKRIIGGEKYTFAIPTNIERRIVEADRLPNGMIRVFLEIPARSEPYQTATTPWEITVDIPYPMTPEQQEVAKEPAKEKNRRTAEIGRAIGASSLVIATLVGGIWMGAQQFQKANPQKAKIKNEQPDTFEGVSPPSALAKEPIIDPETPIENPEETSDETLVQVDPETRDRTDPQE